MDWLSLLSRTPWRRRETLTFPTQALTNDLRRARTCWCARLLGSPVWHACLPPHTPAVGAAQLHPHGFYCRRWHACARISYDSAHPHAQTSTALRTHEDQDALIPSTCAPSKDLSEKPTSSRNWIRLRQPATRVCPRDEWQLLLYVDCASASRATCSSGVHTPE